MSAHKQSFIQGAMILLAAGLLNRLLGFVPRIALPRMIGAEGVGLIQLVYPFMIVLLAVIAGGLPLAVAKLVAEADSRGDAGAVNRIVRGAMTIALSFGLAGAAVCLGLVSWISSEVMTDSRVFSVFLAMIPVLPLVAVSSVWRGYFQGKQNMIPSALSSTTETLVRIVLTLLLAALFLPYGLEAAAAGAMLGTAAGEAAGLLVLWRKAAIEGKRNAEPKQAEDKSPASPSAKRQVYRKLFGISVPVTGNRLIGSVSYLLESILTARSLAVAGLPVAAATAQYGALQGMVMPLLLLPGALTYSLAVSLVPSLSEAAAKQDWATIHKRLHQSMRLTVVTGAPFVIFTSLLAEPVCMLLYGDRSVAGMLRWMSPIAIFIYMQAPLQAALQALDRPGTALFNSFAGAAVKLALIVQLASQPELGIRGAVIAIGVNIVLVTLLNWGSVARLTGFRLNPFDFLKVAAAMMVMSAAAVWLWNSKFLPADSINLLSSAVVSVLLYVILLIVMGLIDRHDAARLPIIGRLFR